VLNKKVVAIVAATGMTVTGFAFGITPAKAFDPVSNSYAIVGSDTLEDVVGALANGTLITGSSVRVKTSTSSTLGSFDATGSGTIITKPSKNRFQRPNGSGDGRTAIEKQIAGSLYTSSYTARDTNWDAQSVDGDIDIVRGSSGGTTSGDGRDVLARYTFGRDAIAYAYGSGLSAGTVGNITATAMAEMYHCKATTLAAYGVTSVVIPQTGSGTRNDFISKLATASGDSSITDSEIVAHSVSTAASLTTTDGGNCILVGQEHDASTLISTAITPMSASRWIAMKNGASYDKSGTASLGSLVPGVASVSGSAPSMTPVVAYYKDAIWGRDTYLFVDRRRVDNNTRTATGTAASAATSVSVDTVANLYAGQAVSGTGVAGGSVVKSIWDTNVAKAYFQSGVATIGVNTLGTAYKVSSSSATTGLDQSAVVTGVGIPANTKIVSTFAGGTIKTDADAANAATTLSVADSNAAKLAINESVSGVGIPSGTFVTAVNTANTHSVVTLNNAITAAITSGTFVTFGAAETLSAAPTANSTSTTQEIIYTLNVRATAASGTQYVSTSAAVGGAGQLVTGAGITDGTYISSVTTGGTLGVVANTAAGVTELLFKSPTSISQGSLVTESAVSSTGNPVVDHIGTGNYVTAAKNGVAAYVNEQASTTLTLDTTDAAKVGVNAYVSGAGVPASTKVLSVDTGTGVVTLNNAVTLNGYNTVTFGGVITLFAATTGALSKDTIVASGTDVANKRYSGDLVDPIKFTAVMKLSAATTAALDGTPNVTLGRTVVLDTAASGAVSGTLSFTSAYYDAVLAALFDYTSTTSLTYQGGASFDYAGMTTTPIINTTAGFGSFTTAAVKLKFGFLPSSVQETKYAY